eukprot:766628-Hanusia_phi.AAC.5
MLARLLSAVLIGCTARVAMAHASLRPSPGEGINANGDVIADQAVAAIRPGGYGYLTELRIGHAEPQMFTYKIEIITPLIAADSAVKSVKPGPVAGWNLKFNMSSSDDKLRRKITYIANIGQELFNDWQVQITLSVAINCMELKDALVRSCGMIGDREVAWVMFPVRQHLCSLDANQVCVPNGQVLDWTGYERPAINETAQKLERKCNGQNNAGIKVFLPSPTTSCPTFKVASGPPDYPTSFIFDEPCKGETCNTELRRVASGAARTLHLSSVHGWMTAVALVCMLAAHGGPAALS